MTAAATTRERAEQETATDSHDELALLVWEGEGGRTGEQKQESAHDYLREYPYDIACR